jgi:hypothetical protein
MIVIAGEVQHSAAERHIRKRVRKGRRRQVFHTKVVAREPRRERSCQTARFVHGAPIRIRPEDFIASSEQVNEITSRTAARVEYPHPGRDAPAQELIEKVDVDRTELLLQ